MGVVTCRLVAVLSSCLVLLLARLCFFLARALACLSIAMASSQRRRCVACAKGSLVGETHAVSQPCSPPLYRACPSPLVQTDEQTRCQGPLHVAACTAQYRACLSWDGPALPVSIDSCTSRAWHLDWALGVDIMVNHSSSGKSFTNVL